MSDHSAIEWTDATWPIVQGCDPYSPGCVSCYVIPLLWRMAHNPNPKIAAPVAGLTERYVNRDGKRILRFTGEVTLREDRLCWPRNWKQPRMIFVPSHGDIFHKKVPDSFIDRIFAAMEEAHWHTYQVLTKRSDRQRDYVTRRYAGRQPPPHVWFGVSAERQAEWDERTADLRATPAAVRFVSAEPLLELIDGRAAFAHVPYRGSPIDWVIIGGESGTEAREHDLQWDRVLIAHCKAAGVAVFEKQLGSNPTLNGAPLALLTGADLKHKKGGDPAEWPEDLRVREWPHRPEAQP